MRIVVSGGGTGGHVTPISALVHHLTSRGNTLHYIGSGNLHEKRLFSGSNVTTHTIPAGKYRRYSGEGWKALLDIRTLILNIRDAVRFAAGFFKSVWLLIRIRPERVFIKGGYVGLPVGLASWVLRIPFIIHESDAVPGLTNRILKRFTPYRVSGFETPGFLALGNPIREDVLRPVSLDRSRFGITSRKPVVLVFGGSQGARPLNAATKELVARSDDFEVIHLSGASGAEDTSYAYYHPHEFLTDDMPHALQLADVIVARAGANTLAELAALGKPAIIVPNPSLAGDHQTKNAMTWQDSVVVMPQDRLDGRELHRVLTRIVGDERRRRELANAIAKRGNPEAAADITEYILYPRKVS